MRHQRPAYEEVTIANGGNTVTLRPTLRAAAILEARHGFPALFRAPFDLDVTTISDIILTACSDRQSAAAFLSSLLGKPLFPFFMAVRQPLADLVSMFIPAPDPKAGTGKPMPWPEVYRALYRIATGQLGWTPESAWNATPTEIAEAYIGRFGTGEKQSDPEQAAQNEALGLDPEFDRAGLRALKAKISKGN
ncbi:phage tail assembly chaperone [Rhizobium laguerreae]|uniref:phage tail assembly chaperone n=1 Tax=Rhizobium laguerreae TaxID=1076926 RepID=UPI001C903A52|nr:phage tail assembly chaperone [Rhizobium laguerreae]MBY3493870.1 phage tail assembly chaperone [Rhizobium laguerreae]